MAELFRLEPQGDPTDYKSFGIKVPKAAFRAATCREIDCEQYLKGWKLRTDTLTEQQIYDATHCGRKYTWLHVSEFENWLVYEAGQSCFRESTHRVRNDMPELFLTKIGDHQMRASQTGGPYVHANAEDWADDLHTHTDHLAEVRERG